MKLLKQIIYILGTYVFLSILCGQYLISTLKYPSSAIIFHNDRIIIFLKMHKGAIIVNTKQRKILEHKSYHKIGHRIGNVSDRCHSHHSSHQIIDLIPIQRFIIGKCIVSQEVLVH